MRAVTRDRYGRPDVLRVEQLPVPSPGPGQVLVEVVATSVNLSDWEGLRGSPAYARLHGPRRPRLRVLGSDIAGRVAAAGAGVSGLGPGDEVNGDNLALMGRLRRVRRGAVRQGPATFEPLARQCVAGDVGIHIDRTFPLDEVPRALAHVGEGRAPGKVVVEIG